MKPRLFTFWQGLLVALLLRLGLIQRALRPHTDTPAMLAVRIQNFLEEVMAAGGRDLLFDSAAFDSTARVRRMKSPCSYSTGLCVSVWNL